MKPSREPIGRISDLTVVVLSTRIGNFVIFATIRWLNFRAHSSGVAIIEIRV